jgi:hypothetical protein
MIASDDGCSTSTAFPDGSDDLDADRDAVDDFGKITSLAGADSRLSLVLTHTVLNAWYDRTNNCCQFMFSKRELNWNQFLA